MITYANLRDCKSRVHDYRMHALADEADPLAFLKEHGARFRGVAGGSVSAQMIENMPNLEIISNFGVGYDSVDMEAAKRRNIRVTNTPDVLNDAVAELTIGLMVALSRRIPQDDQAVRTGNWLISEFPLQTELKGKTVGIYGLGRIGEEVARRCQAMKMRVVYFGRTRKEQVTYKYYADLLAMAQDSDWLIVTAPGGHATRLTVNRAVLEALGADGKLVNMARGSLVDEPALVELLQTGALGGAALDVFENEPNVPPELRVLDNVVLSSHRGSATHETRAAMAKLVMDNLDAHFSRLPLLTPVI